MTRKDFRELTRLSKDLTQPGDIRTLAAHAISAQNQVTISRSHLTRARNQLAHSLNALDAQLKVQATKPQARQSKETKHA